MARGFAVFANGGFKVTPYFIDSVQDANGGEVFKATPLLACPECALPGDDTAFGDTTSSMDEQALSEAAESAVVPAAQRAPQAISPANAYVMTDMMTDVVQRGTAQRALALGRKDIAGKTGTTSDRRDTWFVGFNADIAAARAGVLEAGDPHALSQPHISRSAGLWRGRRGGGVFRQTRSRPDACRGGLDCRPASFTVAG
jgi:penicillin-binding protein 1A